MESYRNILQLIIHFITMDDGCWWLIISFVLSMQ